ncbi:uncharacterized protein [Nicotiana tomentosiformis]|uniref:uncharacterized protein n=1 Tax=Nicotiana tomentosiformis TaxID=4098 RepID=UPI00388C731F
MVKEYPNNDMTENMLQQTFNRGINITNQCVVNQLAGVNFMTMPFAEACDILDEMAETSSAWQSQANVLQVKVQLNQVQDPKQVHAMEGVNVLVNKKRTKGPQMQIRVENYMQDDGGFDQDDSYNEQEEEVQYVNNFQGQRNNFQGSNQQQWRSQNNHGNWNSNNQGNWHNNNNQGNWSGNNQGNWGGNNQGG